MKVAHWTVFNKSGLFRVAESIQKAETALGIVSVLIDTDNGITWAQAEDADIQVVHRHFPPQMIKRLKKPFKEVWVCHGTPEHIFSKAVEESAKGYGHGDMLMVHQYHFQKADAAVTFWPRHQAIWQSLSDKHTKVQLIPMGIDKTFWKPVKSRGKFDGDPSLLTAENPHAIKWPLDLFFLWPWVYPKVNHGNPRLHALYIPRDQHRYYFPLVNRNGCSYASHISPLVFEPAELLNAYCSVDYYIGLVRYGDFNRLSLESNAAGAKTISYAGNLYSDYWVHEGDQREIATELIDVLNGATKPRKKEPVPDISETAKALKAIYEGI